MKRAISKINLAACLLLAAARAVWAVPFQIPVQGYLYDKNDTPYTTTKQVEFRLYQGGSAEGAESGTVVYKERAEVSPGADGTFEYKLGSGTPIEGHTLTIEDFDQSQEIYLEIHIDSFVLLPRLKMGAVPYSFVAKTVEDDGITSSKIKNGTIQGTDIATNTITADNIQAGALGAAVIGANSITSAHIQDGEVKTADLDVNSVTRAKVDVTSFEQSGQGLVPQGAALMFFDRTTCPAGYTRLTSVDGRAIFGADIPNSDPDVPNGVNNTFGSKNHNHTITHTHGMGSHTHGMKNHTHGGTTSAGGVDHTHGTNSTSFSGMEENQTNQDQVYFSEPLMISGWSAWGSGDWIWMGGYHHSHGTGGASAYLHAHNFGTGGPSDNTTDGPSTNTTDGASASNSGDTTTYPPAITCLICVKD